MAKFSSIVGALISIFLISPTAFAQSHLRVPPSQHVILLSEPDDGTCCSAGQCFRFVHFPTRLLPNGQTQRFTIPQGRTLVITDVEWNWLYTGTSDPFPNQQQLFRVGFPNSATDLAKSNALTDQNSFGGASVSLQSGFTVASGNQICGFFAFGSSPFLTSVTLGGYLDENR
jgi:hypothetical protein